jgi:hypothetical protein
MERLFFWWKVALFRPSIKLIPTYAYFFSIDTHPVTNYLDKLNH